MTPDALLFWFLAILTVTTGIAVISLSNPVFSALSLVMTMVGVAALFVTLEAYFIAGVQLVVYAGAVTVLFVMVLMLFDLKTELTSFTRGKFSGALKLASVGITIGIIIGALLISTSTGTSSSAATTSDVDLASVSDLSYLLFTRFLFGFEALGILLLVIAVGTVALSRSKGGTHARHK